MLVEALSFKTSKHNDQSEATPQIATMQFTAFTVLAALLPLAMTSPTPIEERCFSGTFEGGGCKIYATDQLSSDAYPNCVRAFYRPFI